MIDVIKYIFGLQYALIGISIFIMNQLYTKSIDKNIYRYHLFLLLITLLLILSIWVSDTAMLTVFIILSIHFAFYFNKYKPNIYKVLHRKSELYYIISGLIAGGLLIYYAKSHAIRVENYYDFLDIRIFADSFRIFTGTMIDLFLFRIDEPFTSIYSYLILVFLLFLMLKKGNIKYSKNQVKWIVIFTLDLILVFIIILTSKWANLNGIPRRYFGCSYISFWIIFLITFESLQRIKEIKLMNGLLLLTVILGGLGTIYNYKYISPKKLTPTIKTVREFEKLGKIGIISEYWNSYLSSASNPSQIKATPHKDYNVRNQNLVDSVFAQHKIYVIRDMWMDEFPDTLEQFGYCLVKKGEEFRTGGSQVCNYSKIKIHKRFDLEKFKYNDALAIDDRNLGKLIYISANCDSCKDRYFVYGPSIPIGIGKFTARFYIRASNFIDENPVALLDITLDYGMIPLAAKKIDHTDFAADSFRYIDLDFKTVKRYQNLEFRICYYGKADLYFSHVELKEK